MSKKATLEEIAREINEALKKFGNVKARIEGPYIYVDRSDTFGIITGNQITKIVNICNKHDVLFLFSTLYQKPLIKITLSI